MCYVEVVYYGEGGDCDDCDWYLLFGGCGVGGEGYCYGCVICDFFDYEVLFGDEVLLWVDFGFGVGVCVVGYWMYCG